MDSSPIVKVIIREKDTVFSFSASPTELHDKISSILVSEVLVSSAGKPGIQFLNLPVPVMDFARAVAEASATLGVLPALDIIYIDKNGWPIDVRKLEKPEEIAEYLAEEIAGVSSLREAKQILQLPGELPEKKLDEAIRQLRTMDKYSALWLLVSDLLSATFHEAEWRLNRSLILLERAKGSIGLFTYKVGGTAKLREYRGDLVALTNAVANLMEKLKAYHYTSDPKVVIDIADAVFHEVPKIRRRIEELLDKKVYTIVKDIASVILMTSLATPGHGTRTPA